MTIKSKASRHSAIGRVTSRVISRVIVRRRAASVAALSLGLSLAMTACSLGSSGDSDSSGSSGGTAKNKQVVLATHDSWAVPKQVLAEFTKETGYRVKVQSSGDAGELTNKLVLTKGSPMADAAYGVDNTFASRAVNEGVFTDYTPAKSPASAAGFELPDKADAAALTPIDFGDVCVNVDDAWFAKKGIEPPRTLDDLADPKYKNLFVTPGASTSSPGLAFMLATIAKYGEDGWQKYWERLMANGTRITSGWEDAYTVDFTAGGGNGDRPIVLSYDSSPPFTIPKGADKPTTSALLDTCYRQVEYAGVLDGAANPEGAKALVDFMQTPTFQEALPENMYVFPVDDSVKLPDLWAKWAKTPEKPYSVDPATVAEKRDDWLTAWGEITTR
jgi:thiamine transport system substrate-binding protein